MWCLKCGKDTKDEQVFCPQCLAGMEKYPVKTDVHIQLPNRNRNYDKKNAKKKRPPSPEEMVEVLRKKNRRLKTLILILVLCLGAAAYVFVREGTVTKVINRLQRQYVTETSAE